MHFVAKHRFTSIPAWNSSFTVAGPLCTVRLWLCPLTRGCVIFLSLLWAETSTRLREEEGAWGEFQPPQFSVTINQGSIRGKTRLFWTPEQHGWDFMEKAPISSFLFRLVNPTISPWVYSERLEELGRLDLGCSPTCQHPIFLKNFWHEIHLELLMRACIVEFYMAIT